MYGTQEVHRQDIAQAALEVTLLCAQGTHTEPEAWLVVSYAVRERSQVVLSGAMKQPFSSRDAAVARVEQLVRAVY